MTDRAQEGMDGAAAEVPPSFEGTFPSPPAYYARYTEHNLNLLALLRTRSSALSSVIPTAADTEPGTSPSVTPRVELNGNSASLNTATNGVNGVHGTGAAGESDRLDVETQRRVLSDQENVPAWELMELEKPRADWIIEDGLYHTFGDAWPVSAVFLLLQAHLPTNVLGTRAAAHSRRGWC